MAPHNAVDTQASLSLKSLYCGSRGGTKGSVAVAEWGRHKARQTILKITDGRPCGTLNEGKVAQSRYGLSS